MYTYNKESLISTSYKWRFRDTLLYIRGSIAGHCRNIGAPVRVSLYRQILADQFTSRPINQRITPVKSDTCDPFFIDVIIYIQRK